MRRTGWRRWALVGLWTGAATLAGCRSRAPGDASAPGTAGPGRGRVQGLPSTNDATGGAGIITGGVNTFPGTRGEVAVPPAATDTKIPTSAPERPGSVSSDTPDLTHEPSHGEVPGPGDLPGLRFRDRAKPVPNPARVE